MVIITSAEIKTLISQKCNEIGELLGIENDLCLILLHHFHWRKDLLESEWFGNEDKIGKRAGIYPTNPAPIDKSIEFSCPMCFEIKGRNEFESLACNHYVCKECFRDYVQYEVKFKLKGKYYYYYY